MPFHAARAGSPVGLPWQRRDTLVAAAFAGAGLATRWAVRGRSLHSFDSGLLASGILDFDFSRESPHPPYYPLTIAAGKVLVWCGMRPVDALVLLAVLSSGLLAAATYAVGRQVGGRLVGCGAAAFVLLSPTALFNGAVALSYALEGASSAAVAWTAWRVRERPSPLRGVAAGATLAVAVGIRPSAAVFLAPVALWATWRHRRALAGCLAGGAATSFTWFAGMLAAGGGLRAFLTYNSYQTRHVIVSRTAAEEGWEVAGEHLARLGSYVETELPFLAAVAVVAVAFSFLLRHRRRGPALPFLAAWALPGLLFYTFVYVGWPVYPTGYAMVLLPPLAIAAALALRGAASGILASGAPRAAQGVAVALVLAVALAPASWAARWDDAMARQREADGRDAGWRGVEAAFPANETAMVTFLQWHWVRAEHPDYVVWGVLPYWNETGRLLVQVAQSQHRSVDRPTAADFLDGPDEDPHPIPPGIRLVLLPEDGDRDLLKPSVNVTQVTLPSGRVALGFDPAGLSSIEQAMRWFDDDGRLVRETLPQGDLRGL